MNDYVKSIIRQKIADNIEVEIQMFADSFSEDISAKSLKENLFSGCYLNEKIKEVLEMFED